MKRLTTDDTTSIFQGLNLFFAKEKEIWIRGGGSEPDYQDCTLVDWINRVAAAQGIELEADDAETMGDIMYDCLRFGWDATEGILALLHAAAVQAAEMRERLKLIEDILGDDYDLDRLDVILSQCITLREDVAERMKLVGGIPIDRLRELMEADREGRCVVLPGKVGDAVYLTNWFGVTKHTIYRIIDPYFYTDCAKGFSLNDFGKIAFLTQEAAKAALGIAERGIANGQST